MERFLDYFVPERYQLDLLIDKHKKTIGGVVTATGEVLAETVKFHAVGLKILSVTVNEKKAEFKADGKELEVRKLELGTAEIVIEYSGKLNENMQGAYLSTYEYEGKTETIVATQFESHYAREAFPCIDEPAAKAIFELNTALPESDEGDLVLSNMPEAKVRSGVFRSAAARDLAREPRGDGRGRRGARTDFSSGYHVTSFQPTPRMSTYLLAWVVGRLHGKTIKNAHGVEITTYCALNHDADLVDFANEIAAKSLEFYDDNFGVPYPLKKLDQVALPDFEAGAMENWGLVTYRESMMLSGIDSTLATRKSVALTVAHELSHQWFGDLVTMKWWDDLWLNESFASVMEYYAVDAIHPEYKIFESFFLGDATAALTRDAYTDVQSVHQDVNDPEEIATLFDSAIVYAKGARLMLMLIRLMGWENFCKGINDYFEKHKYKNTVGDDLWTALEPYAEFKPKRLMHAFIDRPGYPVVVNKKGNFAEFSQQRFLLDGPCVDGEWPLPKITEDMSGHYILNLTDEDFTERLRNFDTLGLEEKLRLLIDRDLITRAGLGNPASLIELANEFRDEDSAAIWNRVAGLIGNLKAYVDNDSEEEKILKKYTSKLARGKLNEIGIITREGDDENKIRLRANLLGLEYFAEDEEILRELAQFYCSDYLGMEAEVRADILSAKVYFYPSIVSEYVRQFRKIDDPDVRFDYLAAATLARDDDELDKLIMLLGENDIVKPQDQLYLFVWLHRNPKCQARVFEWLTRNWQIVRKIGGDKSLDSYPTLIARAVRTEDGFKKYREFFEPMLDDPSLKRAVQIGISEIGARLKLIRKYKDAVHKAIRMA